MTTWSNLQKIEAGHIEECDSRDVTESPADAIVLAVYDHGSTALDATSVPHLTLTSSEATRTLHLLDKNIKYGKLRSHFFCFILLFISED